MFDLHRAGAGAWAEGVARECVSVPKLWQFSCQLCVSATEQKFVRLTRVCRAQIFACKNYAPRGEYVGVFHGLVGYVRRGKGWRGGATAEWQQSTSLGTEL